MKAALLNLTCTLLLASTVAATEMAPARAQGKANPLPPIKLPTTLSGADKQAYDDVTKASVIPVSKIIFPDYRPRARKESTIPISAWSKKDYQAILQLSSTSEELKQMLADECSSMESKLGGINKHTVLLELKERADGVPPTTVFNIDEDNADSLLAVVPPTWTSTIQMAKATYGNKTAQFKVSTLENQYGVEETKRVLAAYAKREQEKSRPQEVWSFGLAESDWQSKLILLKKLHLIPLGYGAFATDLEPQRQFFDTKEAAEAYAKKLNPGVMPVLKEEGPAELVIDREANVISTSGKVERRELDPAAKKRAEEIDSQSKFLGNTLKFIGLDRFHLADKKVIGVRFQFTGYETNWVPAQATITYVDKGPIKISIPKRYSVSSHCRKAIAIKNFDRYKYLIAQGTCGPSHGVSCRDIMTQLQEWDKTCGIAVLQADWDAVIVRIEKLPPDIESRAAFFRQVRMLSSSAELSDNNQTPLGKIISFQW